MNYFIESCIRLALLFPVILICSCTQQLSTLDSDQPFDSAMFVDNSLADFFSVACKEHPGKSGLLLLRDGQRALGERVILADMAEQHIDAQYYIWNSDTSGRFLIQRLLQAAQRGVRVRLLLDDFSVGDKNEQLLAIQQHPNIDVRVYNPFIMRSTLGKWVNFAFDFYRLNRRMHNKTFVVDGAAAITGGRNIGDEYFAVHEHLNFTDTDLLAVGPVVKQVSRSFNDYWNSPWAVSIDELTEKPVKKRTFEEIIQTQLENPVRKPLPAGREAHFEHYRQMLLNDLVWAQTKFIADIPGGTKGAYSDRPKRVARYLGEQADNSAKEILIESAYFVLDDTALQRIDRIRQRGVSIRALTNSMATNDVLPNHASYAIEREDMLRHGIELYELRPDAQSCEQLIGSKQFCDEDSYLGLHAKAAVFDRRFVYVGSLNFNLRSAYLNTETAMIVDSAELAANLAGQILVNMQRQNSWQVFLKEGQLAWVTDADGKEEVLREEPYTSWLKRTEAKMLMIFPGARYF